MFPSNCLSDLRPQYMDKTPVNGRSSSPFSPRLYDLDDEFIFEQLLFQEQQEVEAHIDGGGIDFTGSGKTGVETESGADLAGLPVSPNRSLQSKARPSKNTRSKVEGSKKLQLIPRKRTGKKDRHSKIHTAQGLRDRRIRLSVHIARRFFDLQEMLGLDKASKTIEWLLAESQDAIAELSKKNCSQSNMDSTPESVMVSDINEAEEEEEVQGCGQSKKRKVSEVQIACTKRDSREKARARSSERTRGQLKMKGMNLEDLQQVNEEENPNCISLDGGFPGQPSRDLDHLDAHETNSLSIIEKFLGITGTATKPGSYPDSSLGNDCYGMIGGVDFLEGNVEEFDGSKSSSFTASNNG